MPEASLRSGAGFSGGLTLVLAGEERRGHVPRQELLLEVVLYSSMTWPTLRRLEEQATRTRVAELWAARAGAYPGAAR